jgi:hypothetical protein
MYTPNPTQRSGAKRYPLALIASSLVATAMGCSSPTDPNQTGTGNSSAVPCIVAGADKFFDCKAKANVFFDTQGVAVANNAAIGLNVANAATGTDGGDFIFSISNTGSSNAAADLIIESMKLEYVPANPQEDPTTGDLAFTCWDGDKKESCEKHKFARIVPTGFEDKTANRVISEHFRIHFKQFDTIERHAKLKITFKDDPDLSSKFAGVFTINLATKLGTPQIKVDPTEVVWGYVKPDTQEHTKFTIRNQGDGALKISKFLFTANAPVFTLDEFGGLTNIPSSDKSVAFETPIVIASGGALDVGVTVSPTDDKLKTGTLTLFSNDPSQPGGATAIPIKANSEVPCIKLSPTAVNFGGVLNGGEDTRTVTVTSCGGTQLCLGGFDFADGTAAPGEFSMDFTPMKAICPDIDVNVGPTKDKPCCIAANGKFTTFTVKYSPADVSPEDPNNKGQQIPDTVNIVATSNAFANPPPSVAVSGTGVLQTCPIAKIDITEGDEVVPQTTLHLKGDGSKGTGGQAIKTYKWTAKQPAGSNKGFQPSSSFPNPTFVPDAAGEYEFCLEVADANGVKSCSQTCQKVLVVPNNAVHVELLWDTPSDPDQTDTGPAAGADMDLHFANYLASGPDIDCDGAGDPWFNNPFDCFWFNNSPQWGSASSAIKDDPTLDLDDTDGAGPENLNLEHPEGDPALPRFYSIGVHYWNDHGYGVSFSTITVYLFGAVALKIDKISMNPLDMWYVGKLNWPNQLTGTSTPPLTVCYQTAGSKPGDVCAGSAKMWQPKGEWCVTPCYINPTFAATTGGATPQNCK